MKLPINIPLISNPYNWLVVWLTVLIFVLALRAIKSKPSTQS